MTDTQQLLADYVATGSETAFRDLVACYVDLVYSAAVRLVNGDTHLAEDVTQTVFADLARLARTLSRDVMLGGWLHRHTCFVAGKTLRGERRRQERERQAVEMNALEDHSAANLAALAPVLDEAVNQLSAEDRAAILLRFFEQQDFRSVGESLGSNEEAARKRVDRALDKLHALLKVRGVTLSGTALAATLAAGSVTAAPAGFALSISTAALASAAAGAGSTLTILQIMSMTKLKVAVITAVVAAGITIPLVMQHQAKIQLAEANGALQQQTQRSEELAAENARLAKLAAQPAPTPVTTNSPSLELLRLRGEVARLRQEVANERLRTNGPSALSGIKANPEMWKLIRDQQKAGMGLIYKDFARKLNLPKEQS
jgi:RNA polymerase sigma factor (sigma-70 family)